MAKNCLEMELIEKVFPKPEELFLEYVRNNEIKKIRELVRDNPEVLEYQYDKPFNGKTIIQIVCSTLSAEIIPQTVQTLIELGIDLSKATNFHYKKQAIHFAAISLNEWLLETICDHLKQEEIDNITFSGDTALLLIIKTCDCKSKNAVKCIRVLIDHNADVNKADDQNISPILHAADKGYREVIAILLENPHVDIDSHTYNSATARDLIIKHNLFDKKKLPSRKTIFTPLWRKIPRIFKKQSEEDFLKLQYDGCHDKSDLIFEMEQIDTISLDPEELFLDLVRNNQITKIQKLLQDKPELLKYQYDKPFNGKTIIHIACSTFSAEITPETLETLIDLGADLSQPSLHHDGKQPIHFAATSLNESLLKVICDHLKQEEIDNTTTNGDTALLLIIYECDCESKSALKCINILIEHNANVNKTPDYIKSSILHAVSVGYHKVVALLLECPKINIDIQISSNKTARELIIEYNLYDKDKLPPRNLLLSEMLETLRDGREEDFLKLKGIEGVVNELYGDETMLQICARLNLYRCANCLLELGANVNGISMKYRDTPLEIAAKHGSYKSAYPENPFFLNYYRDSRMVKLKKAWALKFYSNFCFGGGAEIKFFPSIASGQLYFNSCLHTTSYGECPQLKLVIEKFLLSGAVNLENAFLYLMKFYHPPPVDQKNFDKCLELFLNWDKSLVNRKIEFTYTPLHIASRYRDDRVTLLLLNKGASLGNIDKYGKLPIEDIKMETLKKHLDNCITSSSDNIDDDKLLVIFNYETLFPNKHCTDEDTNINFLMWDIEKKNSEINLISHIANNKKLHSLLTHPLITSFIHIKWHRIRYFYYSNLILYITTWLSLTSHFLMMYSNPDYQQETTSFKTFSNIMEVIIWVIFMFFFVKELLQLVVSPMLYIQQIENLFEIMFIVSIGSFLFLPNPSDNTKKQISAITILVSAFQLVLLIGQYPKLSTNIIMLRTVSYSFFKLLSGNAILILAFASSFYILFSNNMSDDISSNSTDFKYKNDAFNDPGVSLFKTFVMMTGEFDASDINFTTFPIMSRILFIVFIFMIVIVLFNLMNGLAVSDTQEIKSNAELFAYKSRVDHISYIEGMLLGNLTFIPLKLLKFCNIYRLPISRLARLFPTYLEPYKMYVNLNQNGKIELSGRKSVRLDKNTLKNVRVLLKEHYSLKKPDDSLQQKLETVDYTLQKKLDTVDISLQKKLKTVDDLLQKMVETVNDLLQEKLETVDESLQKKLEAIDDLLQKRLETIEEKQKHMMENINKILEKLNRS